MLMLLKESIRFLFTPILILTTYVLIKKLVKYSLYVEKMWKLPCMENQRFLIGNSYEYWKNRSRKREYFLSVAASENRKKGFFVEWISLYPILHVTSWRHHRKILGNKKFLDRGWPAKKVLGGFHGIFFLDNEEWKARRALISPSFVPRVIEGFIPTIINQVRHILAKLEASEGKIIEPLAIMEQHVLSITLETSMGLKNELSTEDRVDFKDCIKRFINSQINQVTWPRSLEEAIVLFRGWINWKNGDDRKKLIDYSSQIIKLRLRSLSSNEANPDNETGVRKRNKIFLDSFLESNPMTKSNGDDQRSLINDLINIMGPSYKTMVTSSMWFLHNMARNPEIQEKLYQEISDFDEGNEDMTIGQINQLTYLDQCVKENLRIHPPLVGTARKTSEDIVLDCYSVPAGTLAVTSILAIHHDEEVYRRPEKFDPSRFEPDNFAKIPPGAYIPFGDGPRRCIAERLALLESKIILGSIIKRFRIAPDETDNVQVVMDFVTKPCNPLRFHFIPRRDI